MAETSPAPLARDLIADMRRRRGIKWLWAGVLLLALLNYAWTFRDLALGWIATDRLVLGLAILVGTVFLVRDRWDAIRREPVAPSRWGLAFLLLSFFLLFVGTRAGLVFVQGMTSVFLRGLSLVALLCGIVILVAGRRVMRHLWMPALLLVFLYPENALTTYWVPLRLQTLAAWLSEKLIALMGIPVVRQGHVLETTAFVANVQEACSGIRSLSTVVPAAIFISAYGLRRPWTKAALIVLAIPVVLFANILRVVGTILLAEYVSHAAAQGFFHYFAGFGVFIFCLVLLVVIWQALQGWERKRKPDNEDAANGLGRGRTRDAAARSSRRLLFRTALVIAVFLELGIAYQTIEIRHVLAAERRVHVRPLAGIPMRIGKWTSETLPDPEDLVRDRHVSDAIYREYRAPGEPPLQVTLLYWRTGEGTFLGRRAHLPETCYPFNGMAQRWTKTRQLQTGSDLLPEVEVTTSAFAHPQRGTVIVTSWQQVGLHAGKIERRAYEGKLGQLIYGIREILRIRSDYPAEVALQLSAPAGEAEDWVVSAEARLAPLFINQAARALLAGQPAP
jgi:exosortase